VVDEDSPTEVRPTEDPVVDGTTVDGTTVDGTTVDGTTVDPVVDGDGARSDEVATPEGVGGTDDEVHDVLPDDLDVSGFVGPYVFPNNNRRRVPGYLYIGLAVVCVALWFATRGNDPVLVNQGMLWAALALGLAGAYHQVAGWNLDVDEQDALVEATRTVGFAVGHASAQLGWRGLLSRPTWRILLYSAENPPQKRGLVLVDGVDGEVIDHFVEDNPEDWSDLDGSLTAP
jgi:hypothetical protein